MKSLNMFSTQNIKCKILTENSKNENTDIQGDKRLGRVFDWSYSLTAVGTTTPCHHLMKKTKTETEALNPHLHIPQQSKTEQHVVIRG